ncbi:MAG TPA: hypothetical protein VGN00_13505 [Puia sp.]|jgi:hypothetical protein
MAKIRKNTGDSDLIESHLLRVGSAYAEPYATGGSFEATNRRFAFADQKAKESGWSHTPIEEINRRFIKLDRSFISQLSQENNVFSGHPEYILREKMKISAELLLSCEPDVISLEVTNEGSIFYTWRKNDISIYLDHYLIEEHDGKDEAIVSIYKNNDKVADFAGSLDEVIVQINNSLVSESIDFPAFA